MKGFLKKSCVILTALAMAAPVALTSCSNDDFDTNQFVGGVHLNSFGPSPVARGGQLRFIGSGMDQIQSITIPGCEPISEIEKVSSEEIRCVVPQEAQPGIVTLTYAGGKIETLTPLTYSEPISLDDFAPSPVKPGETLTIKGEYLNLINEVSFSFMTDSVNVYVDDFLTHTRQEITLKVPAEAISGPISISDAKEMPNVIKSEEDLDVVLPAVAAPLDLSSAKGGDVVTVKGTDFDLVKEVLDPAGNGLQFTYNAEAGSLTFTLPTDISDGSIVAVPASGVKVAIATVGVVVPTEMTITPASGIRAGDDVVIRGVNMNQAYSLSVPGVDETITPSEISGSELVFTWPQMGQSGQIILNLHSGKTVTIAAVTAKCEVTTFSPAEAAPGAPLELRGHNMDLATAVTFAGGTVVTNFSAQAEDGLTLDVPATAQAGPLTLTMANGETVETASLNIKLPDCAYMTAQLNEGEVKGGEVLILQIANGSHLTGVRVNGENVQYILNGDRLMINLPDTAASGTKVELISDNGSLTYTFDIVSIAAQQRVVFDGMYDMGNWDGGGMRIYKADLEGIPAGATMTFHYTATVDAQIQVNDANWGQQAMLEAPASQTTVAMTLTAELLDTFMTVADGWSDTAIVINGHDGIINKVTVDWGGSNRPAARKPHKKHRRK